VVPPEQDPGEGGRRRRHAAAGRGDLPGPVTDRSGDEGESRLSPGRCTRSVCFRFWSRLLLRRLVDGLRQARNLAGRGLLVKDAFCPARSRTDVALRSSSALFSPVPSAMSVRTSLTAVFTVERTWRLRALAFRLCLCRLMPDLILANLCLLAIASLKSVKRY